MHRILSAIAVIAVLATTLVAQEGATKSTTIKFTAKSPGVGDVVSKGTTSDTTNTLNMTMGEMGDMEMKQTIRTKETKKVTVLGVTDGKVTKFKVAYTEIKMEQVQENSMMPEPMVMDMLEGKNPAGNTYIFTVGKDGIAVTDENGKEVDSEMVEFLREAEMPSGKFGAWQPNAGEMFTRREFTIGETIVIPQEKAMAMVPNRNILGEDAKVKVEATLKGKKSIFGVECGVFDIVVSIEGSPDVGGGGGEMMGDIDMSMTIKLKGTMTIGIDNMWVYSIKTTGPLSLDAQIEAEEMSMTMTGKGTVKVSNLNVYSKAKPEKK